MVKLNTPFEFNESTKTIVDCNGFFFIDCHETDALEIIKRLNGYQGIEQQNAELMARVAKLEEAIKYTTDYLDDNRLNSIGSGSKAHTELLDALNVSPAQSLASIQADAIEECCKSVFHDSKSSDRVAFYNYVEQLRNSAKGGE